MKKLFIPLLLSMGVHEVHAQADPSAGGKTALTKTIESFGAIANDGIDDSRAFALAARFFSNRDLVDIDNGDDDQYHPGNLLPPYALNIDYVTQYGILQLGSGTYNVGEQIVDNSSTTTTYAYPKYFSFFSGIDGLIITGNGIDNTLIKHAPGKFGWFNPGTHLPEYGPGGGGQGVGTKMGAIFRSAGDVKNLIIQNLSMDGSSDEYTVGNRQSTTPGDFNVIDYGLLLGGQFVTIQNIDIKNFGCDGINFAISTATPPTGRYNFVMDNVSCKWNGRQALTWSGGKSVKITNSIFAYTCLKNGTTDILNGVQSDVAGSIGTNFDLESEIAPIRDGYIENCSFIGNYGTAASVVIHTDVDNVNFENCIIKGFENADPSKGSGFFAIGIGGDLEHRNFTFNGCTIRGVIDFGRVTPLATNDGWTRFNKCDIASNNVAAYERDYNLLNSMYDKVLFNECTIRSTNARALMDVRPRFGLGTYNNPDDYITFNSCNFISEYDENINGSPAVPGLIKFVRFTGNTKITHAAGAAYNPYYSFIMATTINGSSMISPVNTFQFANHYYYWPYAPYPQEANIFGTYPYIFGETPCESLNVNIGDGLGDPRGGFSNFNLPLYVGQGAILTVKRGSALCLTGDIYLAGQIIVEPGAYFWCSDAKFFYLAGTSFNNHLIILPGAFTTTSPPFIWVPTVTSNYTTVPVTLRSELMAPNQFLRSEVASYRLNYDNPAITCKQCRTLPGEGVGGTDTTICSFVSPPYVQHPFSHNDTLELNTDLDHEINIYPNPTKDKVYVSIDNTNEIFEIQLLDINGRPLYKTMSKGSETEISLSKYRQGTYLIRISNASNTVVKKVVKYK